MTQRLAPHGGCNWQGCTECFPEGLTEPVPQVHVTGVIQYRPVEGGEWKDLSSGWVIVANSHEDILMSKAIARHKMRHGSCYTYRLVERTTVVTDRLI